ncbi:M23 family metallopeptidase [Nordella sp. HKS 07]|uniref:M23 family metallopeptidase n=1 Tax=Nordella sp. HKS 07 TaxID=2712222 RepID=UPI0013E1C7AA|nr:M23 family metallopeptidase [Nordella sp. HKS 07]QIG47101.1 M23 family metallopeptidase [Nordella sp. HKS 07]
MIARGYRKTGNLPVAVNGASQPVHVEQFDTDFDDPFAAEPTRTSHWLLTTCIAGIAGTLVVGAAILGFVGSTGYSNDAMASISTREAQRSNMASSGFLESVTLRPFGESFFDEDDETPEVSGEFVVPQRGVTGEAVYPGISAGDLPYGGGRTVVLDAELAVASVNAENITTISKTPPPEPVDETIRLAAGSTLVDEIVSRGVTREAAQALVASIEPVFPTKQFKDGTEFELTLEQQQDFYGRYVIFPVRLAFRPGPTENILVEADEDGHFVARIDGEKEGTASRYANYDHFRTKARVGSSLYATAKDYKVPDYITAELTRVFAYDVDFQRQVKASDSFEVFYGNPLTGSSKKRKVLHYAQLTLGGKTKTYYRFTDAEGQTDYYDEQGRSATKSLLKTPVSGFKLTSGFGMRRHPLLGYNKMHTGIDFGAPYGTPIRAAGNGKIEVAGRFGAYGIAVKLKHNGKYETLYAHMSRLADGIRAGGNVRQGQVIGYVGSTGRSTGPHLHYEVRMNDRPVNPTRIKASGGRQLADKDMKTFKALKSRIIAMMKVAPTGTRVAQVQQ